MKSYDTIAKPTADMHQISFVFLSTIGVLLVNAKPLPLVNDTNCSVNSTDKTIFEDFFKNHQFDVVWDCGLENLAKLEFDRAAAANKYFPITKNARYYYIITSKGTDLQKALKNIPTLFLEEGKDLDPKSRFGCNYEVRNSELIMACLFEFPYEEDY